MKTRTEYPLDATIRVRRPRALAGPSSGNLSADSPRAAVLRRPGRLGLWCAVALGAGLGLAAAGQGLPSLQVTSRTGGEVELSWATTPDARLESSLMLGSAASWSVAPEPTTLNGGRTVVRVAPSAAARFFRLRSMAARLTTLSETSPSAGETGVAVTRETVFRLSGPLAPDAVVTSGQLAATAAGRRVLSRVELSTDRRTLTLFYLENLPAGARVTVELAGNGLPDEAGRPVDADGDGQPGGIARVTFETAGSTALPGTGVIGRVYASERNPDGSNRPLEGVTVTVDGAEETLRTVTDTSGYFELQPSPAGRFFVHVDGRTAVGSRWPGGDYYPFVGKAWEAVAGKTNNLAGGTGEIFLPRIPAEALQVISATEETRITLPPSVTATNPALAGVSIRVPPDALFSDSGLRGGQVGLAPVAPDRLPEPLPPGLSFPLVITIQTDGPMNFDRPVPVRFPNLPDPATGERLPPGAKTALWSFNHDTGRWEAQGSMTITADGAYAETDPGVGVRQPGWHGTFPGSPGDGPGDDDDGDGDGDDDDGPNCPNGSPPACCQPGGWDELKKQCETQKELALNSTLDTAVDGLDFLLEALPAGCLASAMFETGKTARDCVVVGQFTGECADIATDNGIGFGLSCIPVVGGVLDLGWSGKQLIDNLSAFDSCLDNIKSVCGWEGSPAQRQALAGLARSTAVVSQDPRVEKAAAALDLQIELAAASSNLLARLYGSSAWCKASSASDYAVYQAFLRGLSAAVAPEGPAGTIANSTERAGLLALPRPTGVTATDATRLIDRLQDFAGGSLATDTATRTSIISGLNTYLDVMSRALARGWLDPFDGFREALEALSSMYNPDPEESTAHLGSPSTAVLHAGLPAPETGPAAPIFPGGRHYFLLRDHTSGFVQRGRLNHQGRIEGLMLRASTTYSIAYFDPEREQAGAAYFRSGAVGENTLIPTALLLPMRGSPERLARFPDTDGDGLTDQAEAIIGTNPSGADSDGDGLPDGRELREGTDPLDGVGLPVGVVAAVAGPGVTRELAVESGLAVATGDRGLAVFDVADPREPFPLATLPGSASAVALQARRALVAFSDGLRLVDLENPEAPAVRWTRADIVAVRAVAMGYDAAYALKNQELHRLDPDTGASTGFLRLSTVADDLVLRSHWIYVRSPGELHVVSPAELDLRLVRTVPAPGSQGVGGRRLRLALGGEFLYATHTLGYSVFSLDDPEFPRLLIDHQTTLAGWRDLAPTGDGLALAAVGPNSTDEGRHDVSLYDLRPGGTNAQFVATFAVPGAAGSLTVAGARGFVADEQAGLVVINYLPPDFGTNPPSARLRVNGSETPGAVEGDTLVPWEVLAADDRAVREVAFFVDGNLVARDDAYPFEIAIRTPALTPAQPTPTLRLRARAVDTAGNAADSVEWVLPVVRDATPPKVVSVEPPPAGVILPGLITEVRVAFNEPIGSPVGPSTLSVLHAGNDQLIGTADDGPVAGAVVYDGARQEVVFRAETPLGAGVYQASCPPGLADPAGNVRSASLTWNFQTGAPPFVSVIHPFGPLVRVGGTVDTITAVFSQPLPRVFAETYEWRLSRVGEGGVTTEIAPLDVRLAADARTYTLRPPDPLGGGMYQVNGSGPNLATAQWQFDLRTVPNELLDVTGGVARWKYPPGPLSNDVVVVDVPGTRASVGTQPLRSLVARSDLLIDGTFSVREPAEILAGLSFQRNVVLEPGITHVRGPVTLGPDFASLRLRAHALNLYGGGLLAGSVEFLASDGLLLNHLGSTLILSNAFQVRGQTTLTNPLGSLINLGVLRRMGGTNLLRVEGPRLRNDGRLELAEGGLLIQYLENEGVVELTEGSRLVVSRRARAGSSARLSGGGSVEFGEWDTLRGRLISMADVDWRGSLETTGPLTVHGGVATLWKPVERTAPIEIREPGTLRLIGPARLGLVVVSGGTLAFNSDSEIGSVDLLGAARLEVASSARTRIVGDSRLRQASFTGRGIVEFAGSTVVSNGTQQANVRLLGATVRNTGAWRMDFGSSSGGTLDGASSGPLGGGSFENAGTFEAWTDRPLTIRVPFRNAGRVRFGPGVVTVDARNNAAGAYRPQAGSELVLEGTRLDHGTAGTLDLPEGTLMGTGLIQATAVGTPPKLINRATLRVGHPTGTLTVNMGGGVEFTETSTLVMTLSATAGSRLESRSGLPGMQLGGTLRLEWMTGAAPPEIGQTFELLALTSPSAGDITGAFARVETPDPGPGRRWEIEYQPRRVLAKVVAN